MNTYLIFSIFCAAIITLLAVKKNSSVRLAAAIFSGLLSASIIWQVWPQLIGSAAIVSNWLFIDSFSAIMASLVALLSFFATVISYNYLGHERREGIISDTDIKIYFTLLQVFVLSMSVVVLTNQTLLMWLAMEISTLSSTFLVGLYRKKQSIEAAWKYVIICSTGITLSLIGILLLGFGIHGPGEAGSSAFLLSNLLSKAAFISPDLAKLAFVLIFIGFGAKIGFVPMHTWLPDAHGNAPSPISALFSGILLNIALYVVVRFQLVVNHSLGGHDWTSNFFLIFGLLSILLPAFMMLIQNNYKRMLAYSTIEHMGLIAIGLALPPIGVAAAIIHIIGHALIKSSLFFGAGEILLRYKTAKIDKVRALLIKMPYTAVLFTLGILAIVAVPPSILFVSEYQLFLVLIKAHFVMSILIFLALTVIAFAMLKGVLDMVLSPELVEASAPKERWNLTHSIIGSELLLMLVLMFWFSTAAGQNYLKLIAAQLF